MRRFASDDPFAKEEEKISLTKLMARINEATKVADTTLRTTKFAEERATRKASAKKKMQDIGKVFDKYANKDGLLERKEVEKFAKAEFDLKIPAAYFEKNFFKVLVGNGKGVKKEHFQKLKASVGLLREQMQDDKRRETRIAREKELEKLKEEYTEKVKEATSEVEEAEAKVEKAEGEVTPLPPKAKTMVSSEMASAAEEAEALIKDAREEAATAKKTISELTEGCEPDLKVWFEGQKKKLEVRMTRVDQRVMRITSVCHKFREDARKKEAAEMDVLEKKAIKMLKYHQAAKALTNEELFEAVDADKDGKVSESEWQAFFKSCEKEPKPEKEDAKDGEAKGEEGKEEAKEEEKELEEEDLSKVFSALDEEEENALPKDRFIDLVRKFMKVAKDTVITSGQVIKESKTLRRLDIGEIVEILKGPIEEEAVKVKRVFAKAVSDDVEGWITICGNQGSQFLEEGGHVFKVTVETILTESFELDESNASASKKVKDTTRKLKVGELVDVRVWAKKEEKSGLMRMKCRCRADGATGWVTTVGNQGKKFMEVV